MLNSNHQTRGRPRGSSLLRTLVVAAATLTTLMVCFAIYQSTQKPRVETTSATKAQALALPASQTPPGTDSTLELSPGVRIGGGEGAALSIYPPHGDQAIAEVEAANYFPVQEGGNEIKLIEPLVRLRTKAGQRVNIRGKEGLVEISTTNTSRGRRFQWQRGRLYGDVVVEIDRLSQRERDALPPHEREVLLPWRLITVRLNQIEFDLEYNHVQIDGPFHLTSRELDLEAVGLDVRLDPSGGRVETLKVVEGRSITFRGAAESFNLGGAAASPQSSASWLSVIRAGMAQPAAAPSAPAPAAASNAAADRKPHIDAEGALILSGSSSSDVDAATKPVVTYQARFEGDVQVIHARDGEELGRLEARALEVLRDFGAQERQGGSGSAGTPAADASAPPSVPSPQETLTVAWSGPLVVEWVAPAPDDPPPPAQDRLWIRATGDPVKVADGSGQARAGELVFHRETREVRLIGSQERPIILDSAQQGVIEALDLTATGDEQHRTLVFTGPGRLREGAEPGPQAPAGGSPLTEDVEPRPGSITFSQRLELDLDQVTSRKWDLRNLRTVTSEKMAPREARFFGDIVMQDASSHVRCETLTARFKPDADRLSLLGLEAGGRVEAVLGETPGSTIRCPKLEVDFDPDAARIAPICARAFGGVVATHDTGRLTADDRMVFDFDSRTEQLPGELDLLAEYVQARRRGVDPETVDWAQRREEARRTTRTVQRVALRRLTAFENVRALDPTRSLDVSGRRLECTLDDLRQIETVQVDGTAQSWAKVATETISVEGPSVTVGLTAQNASVPGAGRMSFLSSRDLDGRSVDPPIPIHLAWTKAMDFDSAQNRATFAGAVHATSEHHTFDAESLQIEFEDQPAGPQPEAPKHHAWVLKDALRQISGGPKDAKTLPGDSPFSKEPVLLNAAGRVVAVMDNQDAASGKLLSRARLAGPALTVDLRGGTSVMNVVGEGSLLIEDYESRGRRAAPQPAFLAIGEASDRSQTSVIWSRGMTYDFDKDRATFEGDVDLHYLTGRYMVMQDELGLPPPGEGEDAGRDTRLQCRLLVVDFSSGDSERAAPASPGSGMDTRRIRQFRAVGNVEVIDPQVVLSAQDVTYNRLAQQLLIQGAKGRDAELYIRKPGAVPQRVIESELSLNLETLEFRVLQPRATGTAP